MSDWMTPEERTNFENCEQPFEGGWLIDLVAKADARIRELEAQVKTAHGLLERAKEQVALNNRHLADTGEGTASLYRGNGDVFRAIKDALSRNEAQAKGGDGGE